MPFTGGVYDVWEKPEGGDGMRRRLRWVVLALAAALGLGLWFGWQKAPVQPMRGNGGSVSLGLVLLNAEQGVYVLAVSEQSPAALAGLEPGDYILSAQGETLADIAALDAQLQRTELLELKVRRSDDVLEIRLPDR